MDSRAGDTTVLNSGGTKNWKLVRYQGRHFFSLWVSEQSPLSENLCSLSEEQRSLFLLLLILP